MDSRLCSSSLASPPPPAPRLAVLALSFYIFMVGVIDVRETVQISGTQFDEFGQMGTSLKPPPQQR